MTELFSYQQRGPPGSQLQTFFMPCVGRRDSESGGTRVTVLSPARVTRVVTGPEEPETEVGSGLGGLMRGSVSQSTPRGSQLHRLITVLIVLFLFCCCCICCCGVMMLLGCGQGPAGLTESHCCHRDWPVLVSVYLWLRRTGPRTRTHSLLTADFSSLIRRKSRSKQRAAWTGALAVNVVLSIW